MSTLTAPCSPTSGRGAILAAVCSEKECQAKFDAIEAQRRFGWCGLCGCRGRWFQEVTLATTPVSGGQLIVPCHEACLFVDGNCCTPYMAS